MAKEQYSKRSINEKYGAILWPEWKRSGAITILNRNSFNDKPNGNFIKSLEWDIFQFCANKLFPIFRSWQFACIQRASVFLWASETKYLLVLNTIWNTVERCKVFGYLIFGGLSFLNWISRNHIISLIFGSLHIKWTPMNTLPIPKTFISFGSFFFVQIKPFFYGHSANLYNLKRKNKEGCDKVRIDWSSRFFHQMIAISCRSF